MRRTASSGVPRARSDSLLSHSPLLLTPTADQVLQVSECSNGDCDISRASHCNEVSSHPRCWLASLVSCVSSKYPPTPHLGSRSFALPRTLGCSCSRLAPRSFLLLMASAPLSAPAHNSARHGRALYMINAKCCSGYYSYFRAHEFYIQA